MFSFIKNSIKFKRKSYFGICSSTCNCINTRICSSIGIYCCCSCFTCTNKQVKMNLTNDLLMPPKHVNGMVKLDKDKFKKIVQIPKICVKYMDRKMIKNVMPHIKKCLLKMDKLKPIEEINDGCCIIDGITNITNIIFLFNPSLIKSYNDLPSCLSNFGFNENDLIWENIELNYDNWKADEILKAILPQHQESLSSYSRIGHIVHLNLKEHHYPYKNIIGHVLVDKMPGCRTVVNKSQSIQNIYRNFQLELLYGEENYQVCVKENSSSFEFDFSKVYWNPRLVTEHERIVNLLKPNDILYDVFAGVGPFSVPAAKRKCYVLANDLNPESYKWLEHNVKLNKCNKFCSVFNKDGKDFILTNIKNDLLQRYRSAAATTPTDNNNNFNIHITMNLPATAVEFLNIFCGLFYDQMTDNLNIIKPLVHVYCFVGKCRTQEPEETDKKMMAKCLVEKHLKYQLTTNLVGIYFVRNVSPNKDMFRVSFYLTDEILCTKLSIDDDDHDDDDDEQHCKNKKRKLSTSSFSSVAATTKSE